MEIRLWTLNCEAGTRKRTDSWSWQKMVSNIREGSRARYSFNTWKKDCNDEAAYSILQVLSMQTLVILYSFTCEAVYSCNIPVLGSLSDAPNSSPSSLTTDAIHLRACKGHNASLAAQVLLLCSSNTQLPGYSCCASVQRRSGATT